MMKLPFKDATSVKNSHKTYPIIIWMVGYCTVMVTAILAYLIFSAKPIVDPYDAYSISERAKVFGFNAMRDLVAATQKTSGDKYGPDLIVSEYPTRPLSVTAIDALTTEHYTNGEYDQWHFTDQVILETKEHSQITTTLGVDVAQNNTTGLLAVVGYPTPGVTDDTQIPGHAIDHFTIPLRQDSIIYNNLNLFAQAYLTSYADKGKDFASVTSPDFPPLNWSSPCTGGHKTSSIVTAVDVTGGVNSKTVFEAVIRAQCFISDESFFYIDLPVNVAGNDNGTVYVTGFTDPRAFDGVEVNIHQTPNGEGK